MGPSAIVVVHGGQWNDNTYDGGRKEFIPIPPNGLNFESLLTKIEVRLKKDKSTYTFDLDAIINSPSRETMRMKISDDFELSCLMDLMDLPTIYVTVSRMVTDDRHIENHHLPDSGGFVSMLTAQSNSYNVTSFRNSNVQNLNNEHLDAHIDDDDDDDDDLDYDTGKDFKSDDSCDDEEDDVSDADSLDNCDDVHHCCCGDRNVTPLDGSNEIIAEKHEKSRVWVIPGATYRESLPFDELGVVTDPIPETLCRGVVFSGKERMKIAIGLHHLIKHVEFLTNRSNNERYYLTCKFHDRCQFVMRARSLGNAWRIYRWIPHNCETDLRYQGHPTVRSKVVAAYFVPNLMVEGVVLRPKDIQAHILRKFGVVVKYQTALSGRNQALTMTYGDADKSFQVLPKYLYMLQHANPGSFVELQPDGEGRFHYCFMALAASVRGFNECRPIIVVDATHLKGKYKGIMFVAATKDANEQIFPLAFGIGDKECDASWIWFLRQLRRAFGSPKNMLIVSDQHLSIKNAVQQVYPESHHGLCTYHLQGNLKRWGEHAVTLFQLAAYSYRCKDFDEHMSNLASYSPSAYEKVCSVDPSRWCRSKCPVRRYWFLTSNAAECLNGTLRWARKLPVCTLLESVRSLIGKWFVERREKAESRVDELTEFAAARLGRSVELGRTMVVEAISLSKFKVTSEFKSYLVDLDRRECTCCVFDRDLIPCSHAAAAIRKANQSPLSYVDDYYKTETWRKIYAADVMPVPDPDDWCVPIDILSNVVRTPNNPKQAGRPRENRMKVGSHSKRMRSCTRCHQKGHYQNTCKAVINISAQEESSSKEPRVIKPRKKKRCSVCGVVGHTRLTCLER